jgi:hypothetical protein
VFGITLEGEARVVVCDLPKQPHIVRVSAPEACVTDGPPRHEEGCESADAQSRSPATPGRPFVVRLPG